MPTLQQLETAGAPAWYRRSLFPGPFRADPPPAVLPGERELQVEVDTLKASHWRKLRAQEQLKAAMKRKRTKPKPRPAITPGDYLAQLKADAAFVSQAHDLRHSLDKGKTVGPPIQDEPKPAIIVEIIDAK